VKIEIFKLNSVSKLPNYYGNNSLQVLGKKKKIKILKNCPSLVFRKLVLSRHEAWDLAQAYVSVLLKTLAQIAVGSLMQFEITCRGLVLCWLRI
jgi:hypothetical protein